MYTEKKKLSNKRKLTIVAVAAVSVLVFSVVALYVLRLDDTPEFYFPPPCDGPFAPIDPSEDIWADPDYLALGDRLTVYAEKPPFDSYPIAGPDDLSLGADVAFLYRVLDSVWSGDAELYNSYFSDFYLRVAGEKQDFTPQKLYDVRIRYVKTVNDEKAGYLSLYRIEYKIMDNNGTYRNDIASDESRGVYFYVRATSSGYEVYSIVYPKATTS